MAAYRIAKRSADVQAQPLPAFIRLATPGKWYTMLDQHLMQHNT
jgi:hypothetical protein